VVDGVLVEWNPEPVCFGIAGLPVAFVYTLAMVWYLVLWQAVCLAWYFEPSFLSRDDGFLFCASFELARERRLKATEVARFRCDGEG
jgi:hypothetical protein